MLVGMRGEGRAEGEDVLVERGGGRGCVVKGRKGVKREGGEGIRWCVERVCVVY